MKIFSIFRARMCANVVGFMVFGSLFFGVHDACRAQTITVFDVLVATENLTVVGTTTVQGNSFSVGNSTFVVTQGNVGIGTTTPTALLHMVGAPIMGTGTQFQWIASSGALRAGEVDADQWDPLNIGIFSLAFGFDNEVSGSFSSIGGGDGNDIDSDYSFIGGGQGNGAEMGYVTVVGGSGNGSGGEYGFVGGGLSNDAEGEGGAVVGGEDNSAGGIMTFIGGGNFNGGTDYAAIVGGYGNSGGE